MKKSNYVVAGLIILIVGIFFVTAVVNKSGQWHPDSYVSIKVDGTVRNVSYAVANNLLRGTHTYDFSLPINPGHNTSEIWVSVQDGEMTLIQALSSPNKLCPANPVKTEYTGPTTNKAYHYATEIEVIISSVSMSLQDAIDSGKLCYGWNNWTSKLAMNKEWRGIAMSSDGRYQTAIGTYGSYSVNPNRTYVSSDYGNTWVGKSPAEYWVGYDVAMSSDGRYQTTTGFGGAYQYIYVSSDYGNTWSVKFNGGTSLTPLKITMSSSGMNQFAVLREGSGIHRIYASTDYGNNWVVRNISNLPWTRIAMSSDGAIMTGVAGSSTYNGIYISTDSGATWIKKYSNGSATTYLSGIAMSSDGRYQTATAGSSTSTGLIYISADYGNTWTPKETNRNWMSVAMSSDGRTQTAVDSGSYYTAPGWIYISADYGNTWTPKSTNRSWMDVAMSSDGTIQTSVVYGGQIYISYGD